MGLEQIYYKKISKFYDVDHIYLDRIKKIT